MKRVAALRPEFKNLNTQTKAKWHFPLHLTLRPAPLPWERALFVFMKTVARAIRKRVIRKLFEPDMKLVMSRSLYVGYLAHFGRMKY